MLFILAGMVYGSENPDLKNAHSHFCKNECRGHAKPEADILELSEKRYEGWGHQHSHQTKNLHPSRGNPHHNHQEKPHLPHPHHNTHPKKQQRHR